MRNIAETVQWVMDDIFVFLTGMEPTLTNFLMVGFIVLAILGLLNSVLALIQDKIYNSMSDEEREKVDKEER